jgi:hypothetical protein
MDHRQTTGFYSSLMGPEQGGEEELWVEEAGRWRLRWEICL